MVNYSCWEVLVSIYSAITQKCLLNFIQLLSKIIYCFLFQRNVCLPSTLFRTQSMLLEYVSSPNLTTTPVHLNKTDQSFQVLLPVPLSTAVLLFVISGRAWRWKIESTMACFSPDQISMISALTSVTVHCRSPLKHPHASKEQSAGQRERSCVGKV